MSKLGLLGSLLLPIFLMILGAPLALGIVSPNRVYGFRTAKSLASTENWYSLNAISGAAMVFAGLVALVIVGWVWRSTSHEPKIKILMSCIAVVVALTVATVVPFIRQSSL